MRKVDVLNTFEGRVQSHVLFTGYFWGFFSVKSHKKRSVVAVVELENGMVELFDAKQIRFADKPSDAKGATTGIGPCPRCEVACQLLDAAWDGKSTGYNTQGVNQAHRVVAGGEPPRKVVAKTTNEDKQ